MTLAQRVRDFRYSKGWGPDELASRAEISRTALYQIESGKTGLPRAGTLRRIALALDVAMEDLLGHDHDGDSSHAVGDRTSAARSPRAGLGWMPAEGGPLTLPASTGLKGLTAPGSEETRFAIDSALKGKPNGQESVLVREGELMSKLHDLLHSPLGDGVARIIDELHTLLPRPRSSV
jgi:transcriptional regulator with XRE-family HTH domain